MLLISKMLSRIGKTFKTSIISNGKSSCFDMALNSNLKVIIGLMMYCITQWTKRFVLKLNWILTAFLKIGVALSLPFDASSNTWLWEIKRRMMLSRITSKPLTSPSSQEKNVPSACLCLKAVTCTLGDDDLPTNVVCKVLEGFAKSSTPTFDEFCASQIDLHCGSFYCNLMNSNSLRVNSTMSWMILRILTLT